MHMAYKRIIVFLITSILLIGARASAATLDELAEMGQEALKAGKYIEAIKHYEKIVQIGKTYENLLSVEFDLAWCYYLTSQFVKAIPLFELLSGKRSPSEDIRRQSLFLLAECYGRLAGTLDEGDPECKKNIKKALKLHTQFQSKYPKDKNIPESLYGRAYVYYLDSQYQKAERDLKAVIEQYRTSPTVRDAMYLLASVYSRQALRLRKEGKEAQSQRFQDKARNIFNNLAKGKGTNLAMANDSVFSLAETWFKAEQYLDAINYYHKVRSKIEVLRNIQVLLNQLHQELARAYGKKLDVTLIQQNIDKLKAQKIDISDSPDLMISGYFRIAHAFYRLGRYDEVRAVCGHLLNFTRASKKRQSQYLIINSYIEEKDADSAVAEFENFQQMFGYDIPMVDTVSLSIGQLYLAEGNAESALKHFAKSVEEYPEGKSVEDALYMKFATEYMLDKYQEVTASVNTYLEKFPKGKYAANGLYYQAMAFATLDKWDEALGAVSKVLDEFPKGTQNFTDVDEAFYQKGWMLVESGKPAQAITHLETFLKRFTDSRLCPEAMYQLGIAFYALKQPEKAESNLRTLLKQYPEHYIAPTALYQIAVMCFAREDLSQMATVMEELISRYPDNRLVPDAYFWLGWLAKKNLEYDNAITAFRRCLKTDPSNPRAPESLFLVAQSLNEKATKMGLPTILPDEQRTVYLSLMLNAAQAFEDILVQYPDTTQALDAVPGIADNIYNLVRYRQFNEQEAHDYFSKAFARHKDDSQIIAQLAFAQGSYYIKNNQKNEALAAFNRSFSISPDVHVSPSLLSEYAEALKNANQLSKAEDVYKKIIANYPDDARALAPAWFGLANIKYSTNNFEEARELFEKVLREYKWYDKGKEGRVMLAKVLERSKQYEKAEKMFEEVWRQETGSARIGAMLGVARCQLAQARIAKEQHMALPWHKNIQVADKNLTKIIVLFEAYPEYVAEALWLKGNAYELVEDSQNARKTYSRLVLEYKNYPSAKLAEERLKKLGGILSPG